MYTKEMGSQTYRFKGYSCKEYGVGTYLASKTFIVGGHRWAINLYPNGSNDQCDGHISLYVRLKSGETHADVTRNYLLSEEYDVFATFHLTLIDQSGEGKHAIRRMLGRGREKQIPSHGIKWGFPRYMNKNYLEKSGYMKDDCLVVKCAVRVLTFDISSAVSIRSNHVLSSVDNQVKPFTKMQPTQKSKDWLTVMEIQNMLSACGLLKSRDHQQSDHYCTAIAAGDNTPSIKSGMLPDHETPGSDSIEMLQLVYRGILECSISMNNSESSSPCSISVTSNYSNDLQGDNYTAYSELSSQQLYCLRNIIEQLNSAGCLADCKEVYRVSRKSAVNARLLRFGIEKWSISYIKGLNGEDFTKSIRLWILAAQNFFYNIFPGERQFYERVFNGIGSGLSDNFFLSIVKDVAVELIDSLEAIVAATASFQYMFEILDLYKAISVALPKLKATFRSVGSLDIYSRVTKTIDKLEILTKKLFSSFEDTVLNEQSDSPLPTCKIHSVTIYVMDYVDRMLTYKESLTDILVSLPTKNLGNLDEEQFLGAQGKTPLEQHMTWIIMSLRINLEGKSCHYKDPSMRFAFILYNVDYIVQIISGSPKLLKMIGDDYLSKLSKDLADAAQSYVSSTWDRVLFYLADDGSNQWLTFYRGVSRNALKQRLKKFNKLFGEVCMTQCTQLGPHIQLRGHLLELTLNKLIPSYKTFLDKFTGSESYNVRYIKYSLQALENKVQNLYLEL